MKFILQGAGVRGSATGVLLSSRLLVSADPVQVGGGSRVGVADRAAT